MCAAVKTWASAQLACGRISAVMRHLSPTLSFDQLRMEAPRFRTELVIACCGVGQLCHSHGSEVQAFSIRYKEGILSK